MMILRNYFSGLIIIFFALLITALSSCSVNKRKYRAGYHLDFLSSRKSKVFESNKKNHHVKESSITQISIGQQDRLKIKTTEENGITASLVMDPANEKYYQKTNSILNIGGKFYGLVQTNKNQHPLLNTFREPIKISIPITQIDSTKKKNPLKRGLRLKYISNIFLFLALGIGEPFIYFLILLFILLQFFGTRLICKYFMGNEKNYLLTEQMTENEKKFSKRYFWIFLLNILFFPISFMYFIQNFFLVKYSSWQGKKIHSEKIKDNKRFRVRLKIARTVFTIALIFSSIFLMLLLYVFLFYGGS